MPLHSNSKKYTSFRTSNETYQWCVAPMGLAGTPGMLSRLMRALFGKYPFVVVYLGDICIFSISYSEHLKHSSTVFAVLRKEKLYALIKKCKFARVKVNVLGYTFPAKDYLSTLPRRKQSLSGRHQAPSRNSKVLLVSQATTAALSLTLPI